jgi:hypothetical protein
MDEDMPLFSVGIITGGPEPTPIRDRLSHFQRRTMTERSKWPNTSPRINLVFQLSGSLVRLEIEGVEATRLRKSDMAIMVSAVVPRDLEPEGIERYLSEVLLATKAKASALLVRRRFAGDLGEVGRFIDHLARDPLGATS